MFSNILSKSHISINNNSKISKEEYYLDILFESCDDASFYNFYQNFKNKDLDNNQIDENIWNKLRNINEYLKQVCTSSLESQLDTYLSYDTIQLLNNKSPKINTYKPPNIKISLKEHQRSTIYAMACRELNNIIRIRTKRSFRTGMLRREIKYTTSLSIGILADDVGSGKTLNILSLIAICPISIPYFDRKYACIKNICQKNIKKYENNLTKSLLNKNKICSDILNIIQEYFTKTIKYTETIPTEHFGSYTKLQNAREIKEYIPSNLIIVPHSLFFQWLDDIKNMTTLKVYSIRTKRDQMDIEIFKNHDIVLCNANKYNKLSQFCSGYKWSRIIIDEADTINLPNSTAISCHFLWFITTTFERLEEHKNTGFIKNTFRQLEYNSTYTIYKALKNALVVKTKKADIKNSFTGIIPSFEYNIIKCSPPLWLYLIKNIIGKTLLDKFNAGDITGGIKYLKSNSYIYDFSDMSLIQYLIFRLKRQINNSSHRIYKIEQEIDNCNQHKKHLQVKYYNLLTKKLTRHLKNKTEKENKLNYLIKNLSSYSFCLLCNCQSDNNKIELLCCGINICKLCLDKHLINYKKCPCCVQQINTNLIKKITKNNTKNLKIDFKNNHKMLNLVKIIKNNPNGKFLIFSNYSFNQVINHLDRENFSWKKLCGRPDTIRNIINNYDKGKIKVLMLNAKYYGSGLNLQMTTDIIICHTMDENTKTQIIGRAQRVGRISSLKIHELIYEHEKNDSITQFED